MSVKILHGSAAVPRRGVADGLRETASGLFVPETLSRVRETLSDTDFRTLERATTLLTARGIRVFLQCDQPECQRAPIQRVRNEHGGITFRCEHRDLVFRKL